MTMSADNCNGLNGMTWNLYKMHVFAFNTPVSAVNFLIFDANCV